MLHCKLLLFFAYTLFLTDLIAQQDPIFTKFEGDVYALDFRKVSKSKGYGKHVYEGEKIASISWDKINVSDRHIEESFPDVDRQKMFGMVLYSTMTIFEKSCYQFSLNSDDGSKLWINDQLILDNDRDHEMQLLKKKINLEPGSYKIKIWYHQAYPERYGFIFDAKYAEGPCPEFIIKEKEVSKSIKFTLNEEISFDKDQSLIKDSAKPKLDEISQLILEKKPNKINVVGHTDNTGSSEYNKELSEKRALAIQEYLKGKTEVGSTFTIRAMGEDFPIESNETEEGRSKNRRVEIVLIR